jgi:hypothetical protein
MESFARLSVDWEAVVQLVEKSPNIWTEISPSVVGIAFDLDSAVRYLRKAYGHRVRVKEETGRLHLQAIGGYGHTMNDYPSGQAHLIPGTIQHDGDKE